MLPQEQVAETRKANLDHLFDASNKAVEYVAKLAALNAQAIRPVPKDWFDLAQKSLSTKEPQEWLALQNSIATLMAAGRRLTVISSWTSFQPRGPSLPGLERPNARRTVAR